MLARRHCALEAHANLLAEGRHTAQRHPRWGAQRRGGGCRLHQRRHHRCRHHRRLRRLRRLRLGHVRCEPCQPGLARTVVGVARRPRWLVSIGTARRCELDLARRECGSALHLHIGAGAGTGTGAPAPWRSARRWVRPFPWGAADRGGGKPAGTVRCSLAHHTELLPKLQRLELCCLDARLKPRDRLGLQR